MGGARRARGGAGVEGLPALLRAGAGTPQRRARRSSRFPESKRIFLNGGKFYEPGEILVQPELGRTLERIASLGAKDFYEGETAQLLAKDMEEHGGLITLDDLKKYEAIERKPLTGTYRGYTIVTAPPPSSGGVGVLQMLGMLEGTGLRKGRRRFGVRGPLHDRGDAPLLRRPLRAPRRSGFRQGAAHRACSIPKYIAKLRASIDPERATPSSEIHAGEVRRRTNPTRPRTTRSPTRKATSPSSPTR